MGSENRVVYSTQAREVGGMRKKTPQALPKVSKSEVGALPKTEAVLIRLTKQDKTAITRAASKLHLTVTEFVTKSAMMVAEKVGK